MKKDQIKTPSDLRAFLDEAGSHYFTPSNMRFSGDTMRNYGLRRVTVRAMYHPVTGDHVPGGIEREAFELYRRRAVKHGIRSSAYFDVETLEQIHCRCNEAGEYIND